MTVTIDLRLFAGLQQYSPKDAEAYPIKQGMRIRELLQELKLPKEKAKLLFINGIRVDLDAVLQGGERVGIFPPVGGG